MKLPIIQNRKIYFTFSSILIIVSLLSWVAWGLKPGIDFTGGSLFEIQFKERPSVNQIQEALKDFDLGEVSVQPAGADRMILRFKNVNEDTHHQIIVRIKEDFRKQDDENGEEETGNKKLETGGEGEEIVGTRKEKVDIGGGDEEETGNKEIEKLSPTFESSGDESETEEDNQPAFTITDEQGNPIEGISVGAVTGDGEIISSGSAVDDVQDDDVIELRFESVGPSIGQELRVKSYKAMIYVIIAIIFYVAWAFRKVSKPVTSWKYGVIAVIALIHDVLITIGVFVFLGHFLGVEINTPFIAALLTILGYSVNDSIVVFDRIRENLHRYHEDFEETVNNSVNETLTRSINTSITTLFVLLAVYFFGGETIKNFVLALIIGMAAGTYSSIFIASPLLVTWHKLKEKMG